MKKILSKFVLGIITISHIMVSQAMLPVIDISALIQLANQLAQLKKQTQYIQQQLLNLTPEQYQWSDAQGLINQLGSIVSQTNGIAYSSASANEAFKRAYPGYQPPTDFSQQYKNNINNTQNTLNGVLQSMGTSARDFQAENRRLKFLQQQSQSAKGQTQAIQASSQIASETVSQIQLLRQSVIAQSNAETAYFATQIQSEASSRAELEKIISSGSTQIRGYGTSGNTLKIPGY